MTRMIIDPRTLSPVFVDEPGDGDERPHDPYADCDWEPWCLTHGDMCNREHADCKAPTTAHPRCDGLY